MAWFSNLIDESVESRENGLEGRNLVLNVGHLDVGAATQTQYVSLQLHERALVRQENLFQSLAKGLHVQTAQMKTIWIWRARENLNLR